MTPSAFFFRTSRLLDRVRPRTLRYAVAVPRRTVLSTCRPRSRRRAVLWEIIRRIRASRAAADAASRTQVPRGVATSKMANLITIARLILLFVVIAMIHFRPVDLALPSMILLGVVFAGDGIDGWVARKRRSTSPFGAVFDIAGDRIVETVLWVYFAWERVIPLWAPFLV